MIDGLHPKYNAETDSFEHIHDERDPSGETIHRFFDVILKYIDPVSKDSCFSLSIAETTADEALQVGWRILNRMAVLDLDTVRGIDDLNSRKLMQQDIIKAVSAIKNGTSLLYVVPIAGE